MLIVSFQCFHNGAKQNEKS